MDFIWIWFFFLLLGGFVCFLSKIQISQSFKDGQNSKHSSSCFVLVFIYFKLYQDNESFTSAEPRKCAFRRQFLGFWRLHVPDYVYNSENLNKYVFPHLPNLINMNYCPFLKNPQKWIYQVPSSTSHAD